MLVWIGKSELSVYLSSAYRPHALTVIHPAALKDWKEVYWKLAYAAAFLILDLLVMEIGITYVNRIRMSMFLMEKIVLLIETAAGMENWRNGKLVVENRNKQR